MKNSSPWRVRSKARGLEMVSGRGKCPLLKSRRRCVEDSCRDVKSAPLPCAVGGVSPILRRSGSTLWDPSVKRTQGPKKVRDRIGRAAGGLDSYTLGFEGNLPRDPDRAGECERARRAWLPQLGLGPSACSPNCDGTLRITITPHPWVLAYMCPTGVRGHVTEDLCWPRRGRSPGGPPP